MGILNTTPDSFSDGGRINTISALYCKIDTLIEDGVDIIDIGGESTRPGAIEVDEATELERVRPAIQYIKSHYPNTEFSIDTRKASIARYALDNGSLFFNDVSALTFDPDSIAVVRNTGCKICLMHAQGLPETMQKTPYYTNVVENVFNWLKDRINNVVENGIDFEKIVIDPGLGFGKTTEHNLQLLKNLSMFHNLGCPILLGASRKRFIGEVTQTVNTDARLPGSLTVALYAISKNVQILRVHDVKETKQAVKMWQACSDGIMSKEGH